MEMMKFDQIHKVEKSIFAIAGSGWRADFYLRIAKLLPEHFQVCGVITRSEEKGIEIENTWGVKTYRSIDTLLTESTPSFVVASVAREAAPKVIRELAARNMAVLTETPPASNLDELIQLNVLVQQGARIQVAEQYHLQPLNQARIAIAHSGKLGEISEAQISIANDYHGMSLLRRTLGIRFENAAIRACEFISPIIEGPGRNGYPKKEKMVEAKQVIAYMDFGHKLGIYDFAKDQHRSWARSERFLARGNRGEIKDYQIKYLKDFETPIKFELKRQQAGEDGNLEGHHLKGILAGEEWVYRNPFVPGRLSDDEIAIAACLRNMDVYAKGGPDFYSLAEASQDAYLSLMIEKSLETKENVITKSQSWAF
jgi:hypothetical protein